jgi:hypothetical protein
LDRWWVYFPKLLDIHGASDVRQNETHTTRTTNPDPSVSEVHLGTENNKRHTKPGPDQIAVQIIEAGDNDNFR